MKVLKDKWKWKGKELTSRWITSETFKEFNPINQVYGICFDKKGKILIVKDLDDWILLGGSPEETLKREVWEEANIILGKCLMIGASEVLFPGNPKKEHVEKFYQLRYVALVESVKKQTIDPLHYIGE